MSMWMTDHWCPSRSRGCPGLVPLERIDDIRLAWSEVTSNTVSGEVESRAQHWARSPPAGSTPTFVASWGDPDESFSVLRAPRLDLGGIPHLDETRVGRAVRGSLDRRA